MDGLNPALALILRVRRGLEAGESTRAGLQRFAKGPGEFEKLCQRWLERRERGADGTALLKSVRSPHRRAIFSVLDRGLKGEPIHALLLDLEKEIESACRRDLDRHLAMLPFKLMGPLLLLLFPSLMILLFIPFLDALASGFGP